MAGIDVAGPVSATLEVAPATEATDAVEAEVAKRLKAKSPLGVPWIEPGDVAPAVVFLASDAARLVSGAVHGVGGGSANNLG